MAVADTVISGVSALGGIASGSGGVKAQLDTNRTNMQIAQMNNEFNAEQAQKNRDFQLDMWNRNNAYNTPLARRQRLEQAGYSPYADMSMNAVGGSVPSGSAASAAALPSVQPPDFSNIANAVGNAVDVWSKIVGTKSSQKNMDASTQQILIDNQTRANKNWAEVNKLIADSKYLGSKTLFQGIENKYAEQAQINARTMETESIKNMQASTQQLYYQTALLSKELNGFDEMRKQQLALLAAQTFAQVQSGQLSMKQAATELYKQANLGADTKLKGKQKELVRNQADEQFRDTEYKKRLFTPHHANMMLWQLYYQTERVRTNSGPDGVLGIPNLGFKITRLFLENEEAQAKKMKSNRNKNNVRDVYNYNNPRLRGY